MDVATFSTATLTVPASRRLKEIEEHSANCMVWTKQVRKCVLSTVSMDPRKVSHAILIDTRKSIHLSHAADRSLFVDPVTVFSRASPAAMQKKKDLVSCGSAAIEKDEEGWEGPQKVSRFVCFSSSRWKSRDKELSTLFTLPLNNWLDSLIILSSNRSEYYQANSILHAKCWSDSSSLSSGNFDFRSQPFVVVLSVVDKIHERGGRVPSRRFIHGPIVDSTHSSIFRVARHSRCCGISHLNALPIVLYSPIPQGQVSVRYTWVGLRCEI